MAWLEQHPTSGRFKICFRWGSKKRKKSLATNLRNEAEAALHRFQENLDLVERGRLDFPPDADIGTFLLSDGKLTESPKSKAQMAATTFSDLRDGYLEVHANGALEKSSLATIQMHLRHLEATLNGSFVMKNLQLSHLQQHVTRRTAAKGVNGNPLSAATIKKEVASLRAVWNWGVAMNLVVGPFPNRGLRFPKTKVKPPFQTWQEIESKIGLVTKDSEKKELWDSLYLTLPDIEELLKHVCKAAMHGFVYPMFCFAAYTGARRGEMMRLRWQDIDFVSESAMLREKKRAKGRETSRRVPLSGQIVRVLREWSSEHPGGPFVFSQPLEMPRSRVKPADFTELTRNEAHDHFQRTLAGSKWRVLRGWHVFRHSFISNCASVGVDQRMIDEWVGHQTEEMRKRYRHLLPSSQHAALRSVFGGN